MARLTYMLASAFLEEGGGGNPPNPPPSPPPSVPVTSELDELRMAWRKFLWAEYEIQRLNEYSNKSKSMKDDLERHYKNYREAKAKISKLLID